MSSFQASYPVQWADLDPNFHVRHSVYYDWCATTRIAMLNAYGFTAAFMRQHHIGPIIFREECIFRKEILPSDVVTVKPTLTKARRDFSRWTIVHQIWKNDDVLAATVTVDGAFINTQLRKLAQVPSELICIFQQFPFDENIEWQEVSSE